MKVGLIGCGNISGAYLRNRPLFPQLEIVACADLRDEAAEKTAQSCGLRKMSVEGLLSDPEIEIVLNLTTPQSHVEVNLRALEAGKHVYCEKPFGLDRASARKVLETAERMNRRVGCAPDTFLGGGHQTARKLLDDGLIGKVCSGTAFMMCHGHESWHPAPAFYYQKGGGPLFDMGPYYLTALVNLLGPVKRVSAMANRSADVRKGLKVNEGKAFPVEVETHISAVLEFRDGAVVTLITSFDVWKTSNYSNSIELHGTEGSLHIPDPNAFSGDLRFFKAGLSADWAPADNPFLYNENTRIIGLADMADAILHRREHRANGQNAFHVLDVMCSILESAETGCQVKIQSTAKRPDPLRVGLKQGEIN
jgi:predicted dehydrogenase